MSDAYLANPPQTFEDAYRMACASCAPGVPRMAIMVCSPECFIDLAIAWPEETRQQILTDRSVRVHMPESLLYADSPDCLLRLYLRNVQDIYVIGVE